MGLTLKSAEEISDNTVVKEAVYEKEIVFPTRKVQLTKSRLLAQKEQLLKAIANIDADLLEMEGSK